MLTSSGGSSQYCLPNLMKGLLDPKLEGLWLFPLQSRYRFHANLGILPPVNSCSVWSGACRFVAMSEMVHFLAITSELLQRYYKVPVCNCVLVCAVSTRRDLAGLLLFLGDFIVLAFVPRLQWSTLWQLDVDFVGILSVLQNWHRALTDLMEVLAACFFMANWQKNKIYPPYILQLETELPFH